MKPDAPPTFLALQPEDQCGLTAGIHPTACIESGASIHPTARIGPYVIIGSHVCVGPRCMIEAHSVLQGKTSLGDGNRIGSHVVIGAPAQIRDAEKRGGTIHIGNHNWFREFVTIHPGSKGHCTTVGDRNFFMAYSHAAHDCQIGDDTEIANGVQLAGHVKVENGVCLSGLAAVHQFVRIGTLAFVGAGAMVSQDVPPFSLASGDRAKIYGLNIVGLRRHGYSPEERAILKRALKILLFAGTLQEGLAQVRKEIQENKSIKHLLTFAEATTRGLCRPVRGG